MSTFKKLQVFDLSTDFAKAVRVVEATKPIPAAGEVLVKNIYAGVNASDINVTAGRYFTFGEPPFDIGFEALGTIEAVGPEVILQPGQAVLLFGNQGFSEYLLCKQEKAIPIPELQPEYIALFVVGLTAAIGLDERGNIQKGEKVLITAAEGGTGHIAVQWAKLKGAHVIGTCFSEQKVEFLKSIGCDRVINYKAENLDEVLSKEYPDGIDVIWETIGGSVAEMLFSHLADKGRMILIGGISGYKDEGFPPFNVPDLPVKLLRGSKQLNGFYVPGYQDKFADYVKLLIEKFKAGQLKVKVDNGEESEDGPFVGIESVAKAVNHLHSSKNIGKVFVKLQ